MSEYHVPNASVREFENALGEYLARRRCDKCRLPLGSEPRLHLDRLMYHTACAPAEKTA